MQFPWMFQSWCAWRSAFVNQGQSDWFPYFLLQLRWPLFANRVCQFHNLPVPSLSLSPLHGWARCGPGTRPHALSAALPTATHSPPAKKPPSTRSPPAKTPSATRSPPTKTPPASPGPAPTEKTSSFPFRFPPVSWTIFHFIFSQNSDPGEAKRWI